jgi:hypothetical protein
MRTANTVQGVASFFDFPTEAGYFGVPASHFTPGLEQRFKRLGKFRRGQPFRQNRYGAVLAGARVWERIKPGAVSINHRARVDYIIPGKLDRGGAINLISPRNTTSKNCVGQATSGFLAEVEKATMVQMEEWKKQYPEAFTREYEPASGLRFDVWIKGNIR